MKKMTKMAALLGVLALVSLMAACPSPTQTEEPETQTEEPSVPVENPPSGPVTYAIAINKMEGGTFDAEPLDRQHVDGTVRLSARPDPGKKYRPGSLKVSGKKSGRALTLTEDSDDEWVFSMPAEDVVVNARFMDEDKELHDIIIEEIDHGAIVCDQDCAVEGDAVILTLTVYDADEFRYRDGSLQVVGEDGLIETERVSEGGGEFQWAFTMPDETVTVSALIEFIPYFSVQAAEGMENGGLAISGVETDGDYAGKAREGAVISVIAVPHPGYKAADGDLQVIPAGAVSLSRLEGGATWVFNMADTDLELCAEFAELGLLEIYKGGARKGISTGGLLDDNINKYYENSIEMESEDGGHNGNRRVIKITHALNANGNATQQSFGLFSDTEIDLENIAALSFWAKANKSLNIRFVGFGETDPGRRVVYTGENFNQQIAVSAEWKRYVVPVPAPGRNLKTSRVFMFNALIALGNYVYIDDIEFIKSGVALSAITIANTNNELYYGATTVEKILRGVPVKLSYTSDDGTMVTLQGANSNHTLKHNLSPWLAPFAAVSGNVIFSDGIVIPKADTSAFTLIVGAGGITGNPMTAAVLNGLLLDDFEDMVYNGTRTIPGTPEEARGYLWHTSSSGSTVVARDYLSAVNAEIHSGLGAASWRSAATANNPRGGRNFLAKDAGAYDTLSFWIKVTTGGSVNIKKDTVFTFELRNGGTLTGKTTGNFFTQTFTYDPSADNGWQNITIPLSVFVESGLDTSAITGYVIGVVDNKGAALRVMVDDVALTNEK